MEECFFHSSKVVEEGELWKRVLPQV